MPGKKLWFAAGAGALLALALNLYPRHLAKYHFFTTHQFLLNPPFYRLKPDQLFKRRKTVLTAPILFFGDSRIRMWTFPAAYESLFINRGVGGRTAVQAAAQFQKELTTFQPQIVVVQLGINDLRVLPFFPQQRDEIVANTKAALQQIVQQAQAAGARVVLTTIFPLGRDKAGEPRPFWHAAPVIPAVNEVNDFIHSLADDGVIVFDAASVLAGADGYVQPDYALDYLHLNPAGYERLNTELLPLLLSLAPDIQPL